MQTYADPTSKAGLSPDERPTLKTGAVHSRIFPSFRPADGRGFDGLSRQVEACLAEILPDFAFTDLCKISEEIPLLRYEIVSDGMKSGCMLRILVKSPFMDGLGCFVKDTCAKWLIPGKRLVGAGGLSLRFRFEARPEQEFYFQQELFEFSETADAAAALAHSSQFLDELKITLLAVYRARYLSAMKSVPGGEKLHLLQEHLHALLPPSQHLHAGAFDLMHRLLLKVSEEEKLRLVRKNMNYLVQARPDAFNPETFHEVSAFASRICREFTSWRDPKHISRIVAFHYLFKKGLLEALAKTSEERHVGLKLIHIRSKGSKRLVGLLVGLNLLKESERFERKHLLNAMQSCLPDAQIIADSFLADTCGERAKIFYLEIHKPHHLPFSVEELKRLRHLLPELVKKGVENVVHSIFMPRNEEEVLRTIVSLSKQIRLLKDVPHLTIQYEKQSDNEISFLIVMVRVLKETNRSFKDLIQNAPLKIAIDELRPAGRLKKHPKELAVFRAIVAKAPFFRKDFSLDLKKARQEVAQGLKKIFGEFRDYNGGMIHKQEEAFEQLRKLIGRDDDVLLENFFHALRPGIMQTIHPPELLQRLFQLLQEAIQEDLARKDFTLKTAEEGKYFLAMIGAVAPTFKEGVQAAIARLKISSHDLASNFLMVQEKAVSGFILKTDDPEKRAQFQQALIEAMIAWKLSFSCDVPAPFF